MTAATANATPAELQRLGFVPKAAEAGVKYAETCISYANDKLPASVKPTVTGLEQRISTTVAPVISTLTDQGDKVLHVVDSQLDAAVKTANVVIEKQKEFHAQNLEQYKAARAAYLQKIEELVEFLKEKGLTGTAQVLLDAVKAQLDKVKALPGQLTESAKSALDGLVATYQRLLASPQVQGLVEKARPAASFAWGKYMAVHDFVVANGLYKFGYDKANGMLSYAQGTGLAKSAGARLHPWVAPVSDPLVEQGYYQALLDHVKPAAYP